MLLHRWKNWGSERLNDLPKGLTTCKWQRYPSEPGPWGGLILGALWYTMLSWDSMKWSGSPTHYFLPSLSIFCLWWIHHFGTTVQPTGHLYGEASSHIRQTLSSWESLLLTKRLGEEGSGDRANRKIWGWYNWRYVRWYTFYGVLVAMCIKILIIWICFDAAVSHIEIYPEGIIRQAYKNTKERKKKTKSKRS